ncbi:MAG: hypothetical protein GXN97_04210 [Aquificae bacterium]|nr:hypothetical protein [Aquificota bacterium]
MLKSKESIGIYAQGEGYITALLFYNQYVDGSIDFPTFVVDRIFPSVGKFDRFILLLENIETSTAEALNNLPQPLKERLLVFSKNCQGLEFCHKVEDLIFQPLEFIAEKLSLENLKKNLKTTKEEFPLELVQQLAKKVSFYIPVVVGKRNSYLYAWKYYLSKAGVGSITYLYPRDRGLISNIFSNVAFSDKIFPLILGQLDLVKDLKRKGFVPQQVVLEGKNNLDTELKYILLAREVAKNIVRF